MVFRVGIIKDINVIIREIIKEIIKYMKKKMIIKMIIKKIREMIKIKKSYLKDSLSYSTYA